MKKNKIGQGDTERQAVGRKGVPRAARVPLIRQQTQRENEAWEGKAFQAEEGVNTGSLRAEHVHRLERILVWLGQGEQEEGLKDTRREPGKDQILDGLVLLSMMKCQCRVLRARGSDPYSTKTSLTDIRKARCRQGRCRHEESVRRLQQSPR